MLYSTKDTLNIAYDDYPSAQLVKNNLLQIDNPHIEYVFDCLSETTT